MNKRERTILINAFEHFMLNCEINDPVSNSNVLNDVLIQMCIKDEELLSWVESIQTTDNNYAGMEWIETNKIDEQIEAIEALKHKDDEKDAPEPTPEEIQNFRRKHYRITGGL